MIRLGSGMWRVSSEEKARARGVEGRPAEWTKRGRGSSWGVSSGSGVGSIGMTMGSDREVGKWVPGSIATVSLP
jgi:hypothetical protein